jgi:hypothetical protein
MNTLDLLMKANGYWKMQVGYRKIVGEYEHFVTPISDSKYQIWGYCDEYRYDMYDEKAYDTGIVTLTIDQLEMLITIFLRDHVYDDKDF